MQAYELNVDGLVGPSHHYAGLSNGNLASTKNALSCSNPREAALQGLAKIRLLHQAGLQQAFFPPHQRPNLQLLHQLGFCGSPTAQIEKAYRSAPALLSACYSSSSMWAANTATISASADTADQRLHFTAANLVSNLHRQQEAEFSQQLLETFFADEHYFIHHPILPRSTVMGDEGAANHSRLCAQYNDPGLNLFVYGKQALLRHNQGPAIYPARQSLEASQAIARSHLLNPDQVLFACQNPKAIDQGVFHNDVIAVANESLFLVHQEAFLEQAQVLDQLRNKAKFPLKIIEIPSHRLSVAEAVSTYLFNSQLVTLPSRQGMLLIAPIECQEHRAAQALLNELLADNSNPICQIQCLDLRQSMHNGGGPACLRLRIPMREDELQAMHQGIVVNEGLIARLENWVLCHYRSELQIDDLADPKFMDECLAALDELTHLLHLGSIYPFQQEISS